MKCDQHGFTLIELLVAIFIFTVISVISYQTLSQVLKIEEITGSKAESIAELQHVIGVMERDFLQIAPRPILDEFNNERAAVVIETNPWPRIEFTRGGVANPLDKAKSSLMRVAYELNNSNLIRTTWSVLDRAAQTQPWSQETLLENVDAMTIRAKMGESWQVRWPQISRGSAAVGTYLAELVTTPRVIEITISRKDEPDLKRLFLGAGG